MNSESVFKLLIDQEHVVSVLNEAVEASRDINNNFEAGRVNKAAPKEFRRG